MHKNCGNIKTNGLIIEKCRSERSQIMEFQVRAGIGDQSETRRVRLWKPVTRERSNLRDDFLLRFRTEAILGHTAPQLRLNFVHAFFRTLDTHLSAQLFRFTPSAVRRHHCDAQQLFLKHWHYQSSFQNRFERRMSVRDPLFALPPIHVRMHHLSYNRGGSNDGYLYDEIVELDRSIARQRSHLRSSFYLKHSNRVRAPQRLIDVRIT